MPTQSPLTKSELSSRMQQGFSPIENLWNETSEVTDIQGLDAQQVTKVKENISHAYESMQEVRRILDR